MVKLQVVMCMLRSFLVLFVTQMKILGKSSKSILKIIIWRMLATVDDQSPDQPVTAAAVQHTVVEVVEDASTQEVVELFDQEEEKPKVVMIKRKTFW